MARIHGKGGNVLIGLQTIFDGESALDEQVVANVTATADGTDYRAGAYSSKLALAAGAGTGVVGSKAVSSMDLTPYTQIMAWIKSSVALDAEDFALLTDETALCASPQTHVLPALSANTWTYAKIAKDMSGADYNAVISFGINQTVDKGAMNFWVDLVQAAKAIAGIKSWTIDYKVGSQNTTGFDSAGVSSFTPTITEWSGSFEGFKDGVPLAIGSQIGIEFQESSTPTQQWRGNANITSIQAKTDINGVVTYSYTFQGTRELHVPTT